MVPSRNGPRGAEVASFGLAIFLYVVTPTQIGNQDIVAPETPASRWRDPSIASTFGTIHSAMFRMPQPVGTQIPEPPRVRLASLGLNDVTGSLGLDRAGRSDEAVFPTINRAAKGDRLIFVDADIVLVLTRATTTAPKPSISHKPVMPRWSAAPQCLKRQSVPGYPPTASRQPCPASSFAGVT